MTHRVVLAALSALLVMVQSGPPSPAGTGADLVAADRGPPLALSAPGAAPELEIPVKLAKTLADCDPSMVVDATIDRPANSQDLLACRAVLQKDEPVGRAILWLGSTGLQVSLSASRLYMTIRMVAP
jgi:hypothetical protein